MEGADSLEDIVIPAIAVSNSSYHELLLLAGTTALLNRQDTDGDLQGYVVGCQDINDPVAHVSSSSDSLTGTVIFTDVFSPDELDCYWLFQHTASDCAYPMVQLNFTVFNTLPVSSTSGWTDYVAVWDGDVFNSSGRFLNVWAGDGVQNGPGYMQSYTDTLVVKFHSNAGQSSFQGFMLDYIFFCGFENETLHYFCPAVSAPAIINDTATALHFGEDKYQNNLQCGWLIHNPEQVSDMCIQPVVEVQVSNFDTEEQQDRLELFDGPTEEYLQMGAYHGAGPAQTINLTSTQEFVFIRFVSDSLTAAESLEGVNGFTLNFQFKCASVQSNGTEIVCPARALIQSESGMVTGNGSVTGGMLSLQGPEYMDFMTCGWHLNNIRDSAMCGPGTVPGVEVSLVDCSLQNGGDTLSFYDGFDESAPLMSVVTGSGGSFYGLNSTSSDLFISFNSDYASSYYDDHQGFILEYAFICVAERQCPIPGSNASYLKSSLQTTGVISISEEQYFGNLDCVWSLQNELEASGCTAAIQLHFVEVDITAGDTLYVHDGHNVTAPVSMITGNSIPGDIISTGAAMFLSFASELWVFNGAGFAIEFTFVQQCACGVDCYVCNDTETDTNIDMGGSVCSSCAEHPSHGVMIPVNNQCILTCDQGYYASDPFTCSICGDHCAACNDTMTCNTCEANPVDGVYVANETANHCDLACISGFYQLDNATCLACGVSHCMECQGDGMTCSKCEEDVANGTYVLTTSIDTNDQYISTCELVCNEGNYADMSSSACLPCGLHCQACYEDVNSTGGVCSNCSSSPLHGSLSLADNQCILTCDQGFSSYDDSTCTQSPTGTHHTHFEIRTIRM